MTESFATLKQKAIDVSEIMLRNLANLHSAELRLYDILRNCLDYTTEQNTVYILIEQLGNKMEETERYYAVARAQHKSSLELQIDSRIMEHFEAIHRATVLTNAYIHSTQQQNKQLTERIQEILDACKHNG